MTAKPKDDVQTPESDDAGAVSTVEIPEWAPYVPGSSWDAEQAHTAIMQGHDLVKDEWLDKFVQVPFMITRVVFRKGIQNPKTKWVDAMVSIECVVAPEHVMKRRRVNIPDCDFEPNQQVVFNDGSTGIYRQIVAFLANFGLITLPAKLPEAGAYAESRYDLPPSEWTSINRGESTVKDNGFTEYAADIRLTCPRGLRISTYENDFNPNGKTRYLG